MERGEDINKLLKRAEEKFCHWMLNHFGCPILTEEKQYSYQLHSNIESIHSLD